MAQHEDGLTVVQEAIRAMADALEDVESNVHDAMARGQWLEPIWAQVEKQARRLAGQAALLAKTIDHARNTVRN